MNLKEKLKVIIRGTTDLAKLKKNGLLIGENFHMMEGCIIDPGHCWLIKIGNNVTLAPRVHILAHDASTKLFLNYTKIAKVNIGNNVFIGAGSIILPGVTINDNTIIGAGSVVTKNCSSGVYVGNPAKYIYSLSEYLSKQIELMNEALVYDKKWKIDEGITSEMKDRMNVELNNKIGFIE